MPIPTFLYLIAAVIIAAGASIALAHVLGVSFIWLGLLAVALTIVVRGLRWL